MPQNSPFLLHFPVFAQLFVSHAPVWAPCGRDGRFAAHGSRFFCGAMGTPRPCKRFAVFAAAGVCLVDCTPANGTPFSLSNGVRVCCRYAIRFFVPPALPLIPGSPLLILFAPAPSFQSILCKLQPLTRHSVRHILYNKGGAALCKFATGLFEAAVSCCNFAQGIARILCRTFPEHVGKTHRIALFPYAAYRWKIAQVTPGTVAFYTGYSRSPAPL